MLQGAGIAPLCPGPSGKISQIKRTTLTVGIFGQGFEEDGLRASGTALTGRATHLLVDRGTHLLHLWLSGSYCHVGSTDSIQYGSAGKRL